MPQAIWNGTIIAESEIFENVEGNIYFPPTALKMIHFRPSDQTSSCLWKGTAKYYDVVVGNNVNKNAAWYYPEPSKAASKIAGYVAFWRGVEIKR
ncbi:MAG: DUF427 domain-containing protein [Nitrospiraceae bacterium]